MKKILVILLFISCKCESQITIVESAQGAHTYSTTAIGAVTSQTYTAGKLYLCIHMRVDGTPNPPADFSLTGTSSTWTEIANVTGITTGTATARLKVWRYAPSSNVTEALSFSGAALQDGSVVVLYEITGTLLTGSNGADAIVQIVTGSADAGANPSITMAALTGSRNTVLAFFGNDVNPFGSTEESGWTEISENGFDTPTTGGVFIKRNTTTDNTPSVTASASNWVGVAIELALSGRRIYNIN